MLLSNVNNNYTFTYMIHKHTHCKLEKISEFESSEEETEDYIYSWSLFVKIRR